MKNFKTVPVLIADSFGSIDDVSLEQLKLIPELKGKIFFEEHQGAPNTPANPHGWMAFSKFWPIIFSNECLPKIEFHLLRFIDSQMLYAEWWIHDYAKKLIDTYGCLVWSNSWGTPRRFGTPASNYWFPWANTVNRLAENNPYAFIVFASGNEGPIEAGWPQSFITEGFVIGANQRSGKLAKFSSWTKKMFGVAGGQAVAVADPSKKGYTFASGTSFSCPAFAALCAHSLCTQGYSRGEFVSSMIQVAKRPPEIAKFSNYWGFGDFEPLYQSIAAKNNAWKKLNYPNQFKTYMANMTSFMHDKTLPIPNTKISKPVLPKF